MKIGPITIIHAVVAIVMMAATLQASADWTRSGNTITDANGWVLKVADKTINGVSGLSILGDAVSVKGTPTGVLDLSGAISDGSVIVELNDYALRSSSAGALYSVTLPDTVIRLGGYLFSGQSSLTNVVPLLPQSVEVIGTQPFYNVPIRGALDMSSVTNMTGSSHFRVTSITSVVMGVGLKVIPAYAFDACSKLESLRLPEDVEVIEYNAFSGCSKLVDISPAFPDTVASVGSQSFSYVQYPGRVAILNREYTAVNSQFFMNGKVSEFEFGVGVANIATYAFDGIGGNGSRAWDLRFQGDVPTFLGPRGEVFRGTSDWKLRVFYPFYNSTWTNWIAANAVPLTSAQTNAYIAAYPDAALPVGRGNTGTIFANYYLFPWNPLGSEGALLVEGRPFARDHITPSYGSMTNVVNGTQIVCSAPAAITNAGIIYTCEGYVTESLGAYGWQNPVTNAATSFTYTQAGTAQTRLTWLWDEAKYMLSGLDSVSMPAALGSVDRSAEPDENGYYPAGAEIVLTPIAASGVPTPTFRRWWHDVPAGLETATPLTVVMDSPKHITPEFARDWVFTAGNPANISDGYWTLKVNGTTNLTIRSDYKSAPIPSLDLAKPVSDGRRIVGIGSYAFRLGQNASQIDSLTLPNTLTTIGEFAFTGQNTLSDITPCIPLSVKSMGGGIFSGAPYKGAVEILNPEVTTLPALFGNWCRFSSITLGEGVTAIGDYALDRYGSDGSIPWDWYFCGGVPTFGPGFIRSTQQWKLRVFIPRGRPDWDAWLAANVVPLTQAQKDAYAATYDDGTVPFGRGTSTSGFNNQYFVTWVPPKDKLRTTILVIR